MSSLMWAGLLTLGTAPQWLGLLIVRLNYVCVALCWTLSPQVGRQAAGGGKPTWLLLLYSPVYPSRQGCSQGRALAGIGGQLLLWNAITSLSWGTKGFNLFHTWYNRNLFKILLLWLCSPVLPLWPLLAYLLQSKKVYLLISGKEKITFGNMVGKLESAVYYDLLRFNSKTFSITGFAVLYDQHSLIFLWEEQNKCFCVFSYVLA